MTLRNSIIILLYIVAGFSACKPIEIPPDVQETPIYSAFWTTTEGNTEIEAGVDGYQLETTMDFEDSLFVISSRLEDTDCFDICGPSLEFRFYDLENNGSTTIHPDLLVSNMSYPFTGSQFITDADTSAFYTLLFTAKTDSIGGSQLNHSWTINDTITFVGESIVYTALVSDPMYVCLTSDGGLLDPDCNTTQCRTISPVAGAPDFLSTGIEAVQGGMFLQATTTGGSPPYTYSWSTGETTASIQVNSPGQYVVEVTDADGGYAYSAVQTPQMPVGGFLCSAVFEYESDGFLNIVPGDTITTSIFGSVEVIYEEGEERFLSSLGDQAPASFVIIDQITEVDSPIPGAELKIRFDVRLYEETTLAEKTISNGEAVLFFRYP